MLLYILWLLLLLLCGNITRSRISSITASDGHNGSSNHTLHTTTITISVVATSKITIAAATTTIDTAFTNNNIYTDNYGVEDGLIKSESLSYFQSFNYD